MGHCIQHIVAERNADRDEILADIRNEVEHEDWAEGGSYPGNLHLSSHWHDGEIYDGYEEAIEAIERYDKGWYDDHAVLFHDTRALENAKTKKIAEQIAKNKEKKSEYVEANHVTSRKSAFIRCPSCGSKLSREHLKRDSCPLCGTDLRSDSVRARISGFDDKGRELEEKLADEKRKLARNAPVKWLIKYEYHV